MNELTRIIIDGNTHKVDSRIIAENFEKVHRDVVRAIENLIPQIDMRNFAHISKDYFILKEYTDAQGRTQRFYDITFKGFILLVGGFTGKKALDCKLDYIDTFMWLMQEYHKKTAAPEIPLINLTTVNGMPIEVFDYLVPKGMTFREGFLWLSTDMYDMVLKFRDKVAARIERKLLKQQVRLEAKQKALESATEVED